MRWIVRAEGRRSVFERPRYFSSASGNKWGSLDSSRKRQQSSAPESNKRRQRLVSIAEFRETVRMFYDKVEKGVAPMVKINTNMVAERSGQEDGWTPNATERSLRVIITPGRAPGAV